MNTIHATQNSNDDSNRGESRDPLSSLKNECSVSDDVVAYRARVQEYLSLLIPVFEKAAAGGFSEVIELPSGEDEMRELYAGVQQLFNVMRKRVGEQREVNSVLERKIEARTSALAEAQSLAHIGSWEWEIEEGLVSLSAEVYDLFNVSQGEVELTFKNFLDFVHPLDKRIVQNSILSAFRQREAFDLDHRIIRRDGAMRWHHITGRVISDEEHRPRRVVGTVQDVTSRRQIEDMLRLSEERYRSLFENATDVVYTLSLDHKVVALNKAFETLTGWKRAEWIGLPLVKMLHSDDTDEASARLNRVVLGERIPPQELRIVLKNGSEIVGEFMTAPLVSDKKIVGILGIVRDITDRKRAAELQAFMAAIIQSSDQAIVGRDLSGTIVSWNPGAERIFGYAADEAIGRHSSLIVPSSEQEELDDLVRELRHGGGVIHVETIRKRKDGTNIELSMSISPIRGQHGEMVGISTIAHDITQHKNLQRQLEETNRQRTGDLQRYSLSIQAAQENERRRITRELHDDFGQQLTGMKFAIEVLQDSLPKLDKKANAKIEGIKKSIEELVGGIRRLSANLHPTALDDFGLATALRLLCKDVERIHDLRMNFSAANISTERFDPRIEIAIYRIAQEGLTNVVKHSAATITNVTLTREAQQLVLRIEDNGQGFDPAETRRRAGQQGGLGLMSMNERSEQLGGAYKIESTPGRGTVITVSLPTKLKV